MRPSAASRCSSLRVVMKLGFSLGGGGGGVGVELVSTDASFGRDVVVDKVEERMYAWCRDCLRQRVAGLMT